MPAADRNPAYRADHQRMKRFLIYEPHEMVRRMLVRMLTRLDYEPIVAQMPTAEQFLAAEALLIEPVAPAGVLLAQAVRIAAPTLPLLCASITAPAAELAELGIEFDTVLVKPFTSEQLEVAILQCRARRTIERRVA
jgi:CheY-like chemotaxis protein